MDDRRVRHRPDSLQRANPYAGHTGTRPEGRRLQVMLLAACGLTDGAIGAILDISPSTAKSMRSAAIDDFDARSTSHAALRALCAAKVGAPEIAWAEYEAARWRMAHDENPRVSETWVA